MPSFELGKLQAVTGVRALSDTDRTASGALDKTRAGQPAGKAAASAADSGVSLEIGAPAKTASVSAAAPPVDADRVSEIRSALREGTYPLVPAKIADAIIAAQYSFEIER